MCVTEPEVAEWLEGNVGLAHAYSGTCAVDVDDLERSIAWLAERTIDLPALLAAPDAVRIESRPGRAKLLYAVPSPLPSFKLGPLELRCASSNGYTLQDVLPPSIHPDTGKPYTWLGDWHKLPPLPPQLAALWTSLSATRVTSKPTVKQKPAGKLAEVLPQLRAALDALDPDAGYEDWIAAGMAIHFETRGSAHGLALWNEWSSRGEKYKGIGDLETHWRSFRTDHETPKTLASLVKDKPASADEFPDEPDGPMLPAVRSTPLAVSALRSREQVAEMLRSLRRTKHGTIEARLSNVSAVLGVPELCGWTLAQDEYLGAVVMAPVNTTDFRPLRDVDYTNLRVWLETVGNCDPISHEMMRHAVHLVADQTRMDSGREWLGRLKWDGVPRIAKFYATYFSTKDDEYHAAASMYTWTALAARLMEPGCQADMVPVLIGRQGVGKSRGVQAMAPSIEQFAELRLDEPDDTIARKMRGVVVAELAEMRGLRATELERAKALITRTHEKWIPKYQEFAVDYPRRFIIVGTTNDDEFLPQDDQQRRWLPMTCGKVKVDEIRRDRDQLWAEAAATWAIDGIFWHGLDYLAAEAREHAQGDDAWEPAIAAWLADQRGPVKLQDVLVHGVGLDYRTITRAAEYRGARVLRRLGYMKKVLREGKVVSRAWTLDPNHNRE